MFLEVKGHDAQYPQLVDSWKLLTESYNKSEQWTLWILEHVATSFGNGEYKNRIRKMGKYLKWLRASLSM